MFSSKDDLLDSVSGEEALALYQAFHRSFVQRKKQELINPNFIGIGEISLPRGSLIHHWPANSDDIGPSTSEAFISNYDDQVFIEFIHEFEPIMGNGRRIQLEIRKAIQAYRASHYNYNWTKDIKTVYNKDKVLVVKAYGLIDKLWVPRPTQFVNFEMHYNRLSTLIKSINEEAEKGRRLQYYRIDLPMHMPGFKELLTDYDNYIKGFKDGLPTPAVNNVRVTKAEGCYWLLDWIAFLFGDYEYSLYGKLSEKAIQTTHFMFVFNSRTLILRLNVLKEWLEELNDKNYLKKKAEGKIKEGSEREAHPKRLNVAKRVYLALLNLTRNGVTEQDIVEEKQSETRPQETVRGVAGEETDVEEHGKSPLREQKRQDQTRKDEDVATDSDSGSLLDLFNSSKGTDNGTSEAEGETGDSSDPTDADDWTSEVDDKLLEQETVVTEISVKKDPFPTFESGIALALEERAKEGSLTVAEQQFFMRKATQYKHIELENGQSLEEFIRIKPEELKTLKEDAKIAGDIPTIHDQSMLQNRAKVLKQGYVDKFLHKDIVKMFLGIQNAGVAINDFKHEVINSVEGSYDVYRLQVHPVDGEQSTIPIRLPRVNKDGTFTVDGVKSHMQLQRMEDPIRKINKHKVALTSYYDRKLMITRSQKVVDDLGVWMTKQVLLRSQQDNAITFSRGNSYDPAYRAPRIYSILGSKFQWIKTPDFTLDFRLAHLLEQHPEFNKLTKQDNFLVGVKDKKPLTVDNFGNLFLGDTEVGTIEGVLGINTSKAPTEYAVINISGYLFPIGVVLCYYFGIDQLLKVIKATTRSVPVGTRPKLSQDEYAIAFNDEYLIFNRREKLTTLIFGGMSKLNNISNFSRSDLNSQNIWLPLMGDPKVRPTQFQEMKNLYDLFIDPITKEVLIKRGYSDSFHYLLIDAVKLLETDYTRHEVEIEEQRIVGYERFAGHIYREMVKANRVYRSKGKGRKHKFEMNPEAVIMSIITDTSVNLVEEVGPIHQLKDQEEVTFGGTGGRSEITVVKRARVQLESYRGIISESNKDSGKVGFVTYTTSDPLIEDYRGNVSTKEKPTNTGLNSVVGNLAFGLHRDDQNGPSKEQFLDA